MPKRKVFKDPSFPTEGEPLKPNTAEGSSSKVSSELKKDGKVCFYLTRCKESSRLAILDFKLSLPRKEVIQPHLPVRLPCYDFTPLTLHTFGASPLDGWAGDFGCRRLGWCDGRCVQGPGTYSPRHADPRLLATPTSCRRIAACNPNWDRF